MECSLDNLPSCMAEVFFEFALSLLKAPLEILLDFTKDLLIEPVKISLFSGLWVIVVYIISLFYGLFFLFAGFNFIISGNDVAKRENAKSWIANVILMILFVQVSFFLYDLILELGSLLTSGVFNLIDPDFFLPHISDLNGLGLELVLILPYISIIVFTMILLGLRYLFVSVGIVFFPLGIFFYFIPPLRPYGKVILSTLIVAIFATFFSSIILLGASKLMDLSLFNGFNIVIASVAFLAVDLLMGFLIVFAMLKAAFSIINSDFGRNVTKAVKYFV